MTRACNDNAPLSRGSGESLSPKAQARIAQGLKALFDTIAQEPIPEHLLRLLRRLDCEKTTSKR